MSDFNLGDFAQLWLNMILLWIGFATVVGLVVSSLFPGKEPGGLLGTLLIGILGSCLGPLCVSVFWDIEGFNPISPVGFFASVVCAFLCLTIFRVFRVLFARSSGSSQGTPVP